MDHIKEALQKAKLDADSKPAVPVEPKPVAPTQADASARDAVGIDPSWAVRDTPQGQWTPPVAQLNARHLERNHIVSYAMTDPSHIAFNLLRTRAHKVMTDNHWKSLAITSPTPNCGKTMVAANLAFSLARSADCKVVLVDLDLRRPSLGKALGISSPGSIAQFLGGNGRVEDCFVQLTDTLVVGLNEDSLRESSELIRSPRMRELMSFVNSSLSADVSIYDLPPMRSSDDALAFLPSVDTTLLVAAAGLTTGPEIDECERQISQLDKMLGVVLNKSEEQQAEYYY